jgi:putative hydrolase of the HAD superfamily
MSPSRETIFRDAVAELGFDFTIEEVRQAYSLVDFSLKIKSSRIRSEGDRREFFCAFNEALCMALGIESAFGYLKAVLMSKFEMRRWIATPEAHDVLAPLAASTPLFVLANWDSGLEELLEVQGLRSFFKGVFSSANLGAEKPSPECFSGFLANTGINPSAAIYVGDEYVADVVGARRAGFCPVLLDRNDSMRLADCIRIRKLTELLSLCRPDGAERAV